MKDSLLTTMAKVTAIGVGVISILTAFALISGVPGRVANIEAITKEHDRAIHALEREYSLIQQELRFIRADLNEIKQLIRDK